ncbi:Hypothetical protein P9215_18231 [Prochlorococcus marinus str. MIT 9215]|uniref:Uncharacterized protein n=1 Tax=Prochlorococcus marinus (strain MIT 9215) TaxID=93060 RepID=A8G755_PROM2|nr:Hypothetical protein P9215_18231 [Prochlorococcus marinus str. MIT 9215]
MTSTFDISCHSSPTCLNLTCSYPPTVLSLESKLTESNSITFGGHSSHSASVLFTKFSTFWTKHFCTSYEFSFERSSNC